MHLGKQQGSQNAIRKLIFDDEEIVIDQTHFRTYLREFYETIFKRREHRTAAEIKIFLSNVDIPKLIDDKAKLCEKDLTEEDLYDSHKSK